ncbi:MAG: heavy-metal-associated domain-containing protein [Oscillospiraceae bacterium]|nr:heavy-metal-associated domain-containing protein [Oscillospiraceae bacterium]
MENLIIIAVLALVVAIGVLSTVKHFRKKSGCCGSGTFRENKKLAHVAGKKTVRIEGMMCENCEARVERYLNEIPGAAARASHRKNTAVVSYESAISDEQIRAAVEKAGYKILEIS